MRHGFDGYVGGASAPISARPPPAKIGAEAPPTVSVRSSPPNLMAGERQEKAGSGVNALLPGALAEGGGVAFQVLLLLRRVLPAEDGVAVREATEALDDVVMQLREVGERAEGLAQRRRDLVRQRREDHDRIRLHAQAFGMLH